MRRRPLQQIGGTSPLLEFERIVQLFADALRRWMRRAFAVVDLRRAARRPTRNTPLSLQ